MGRLGEGVSKLLPSPSVRTPPEGRSLRRGFAFAVITFRRMKSLEIRQGADRDLCRSRLVHDFDRVPPDDLLSFVTLRREVSPSLRFVKCFRLLQAVPLGDAHTLGSRRPL